MALILKNVSTSFAMQQCLMQKRKIIIQVHYVWWHI